MTLPIVVPCMISQKIKTESNQTSLVKELYRHTCASWHWMNQQQLKIKSLVFANTLAYETHYLSGSHSIEFESLFSRHFGYKSYVLVNSYRTRQFGSYEFLMHFSPRFSPIICYVNKYSSFIDETQILIGKYWHNLLKR